MTMFSIANFLTSFLIGYSSLSHICGLSHQILVFLSDGSSHVSDIMGRKKLMLLGMATGSLCTLGHWLLHSVVRLFVCSTHTALRVFLYLALRHLSCSRNPYND
jgi:MFS family permease